MTIYRDEDNEVWVECNQCADTFYSGTSDFYEALDLMKQEGWRTILDDADEWQHFCPACME